MSVAQAAVVEAVRWHGLTCGWLTPDLAAVVDLNEVSVLCRNETIVTIKFVEGGFRVGMGGPTLRYVDPDWQGKFDKQLHNWMEARRMVGPLASDDVPGHAMPVFGPRNAVRFGQLSVPKFANAMKGLPPFPPIREIMSGPPTMKEHVTELIVRKIDQDLMSMLNAFAVSNFGPGHEVGLDEA